MSVDPRLEFFLYGFFAFPLLIGAACLFGYLVSILVTTIFD